MTDCLITAITKSVMLTAIHNQPKFSNLFMDHLLSRNSRIQADVVDQLFNSSEKRLARLLLLPGELWEGRQSTHRASYHKSGDAWGNDGHTDDRDHLFRSIATSVARALTAPLDGGGDVSLLMAGQAR